MVHRNDTGTSLANTLRQYHSNGIILAEDCPPPHRHERCVHILTVTMVISNHLTRIRHEAMDCEAGPHNKNLTFLLGGRSIFHKLKHGRATSLQKAGDEARARKSWGE